MRDAIIDAIDWHGLVDLALSPIDVGRGRPYPDLVLAAAEHFGVEPAETAVCGDTVSDLLCGTRAGAAVVAGIVPSPERAAEMAATPHTHLLTSVAELPAIVLGAD
jgi:beta-phosphoglucomutase-like phosphatase (HAD superfamily)